MSVRPFLKMHGLGNDFVVFDAREAPLAMTGAMARGLADRHTGIGCDQLILVEPGSGPGAVRVQFWNQDGSVSGACGNGSRAVAALVGSDVVIETEGGALAATVGDGGAVVDMGLPDFGWQAVPLAYAMDTLSLPLAWEVLANPVAVSVGNPHAVFFVDDAAAVPLDVLGPVIEHDAVFPERVNVGVAQVVSRGRIALRVWERGAGLTRACGTGAVAATAAAQRRGLVDDVVTVTLPGGELVISRRADGHLLMAGPATLAFRGEIDLEQFR